MNTRLAKISLVFASAIMTALIVSTSPATSGECGLEVYAQLNFTYSRVSLQVFPGGPSFIVCQGLPGPKNKIWHMCLCENSGTGYGNCFYWWAESPEPPPPVEDPGCTFGGADPPTASDCRCTQPSSICCD